MGQVEEQFGAQGSYLIDFYHVCEYLSDAAKAIAPEPAAQKAWMEAQKDALKTGGLDKALQALARHFEAAEVDDDHAPVCRCRLGAHFVLERPISRGATTRGRKPKNAAGTAAWHQVL